MQYSYNEQWQKITSAYLNDRLQPYSNCACFIGNLLGGRSDWAISRKHIVNRLGLEMNDSVFTFEFGEATLMDSIKFIEGFGYTPEQIIRMEHNFLNLLTNGRGFLVGSHSGEYEDYLYRTMVSTLEMLKKVHEDNGEVIDAPVLEKRILQPAV